MLESLNQIPHSALAEQNLIGAYLYDPKKFEVCLKAKLEADDFFISKHKYIYTASMAVFTDTRSIDTVLIIEHLKKIGMLDRVGGMSYIHEMIDRLNVSAMIEQYIAIVKSKAARRMIIEKAQLAISMAGDANHDDKTLLPVIIHEFHALESTKEERKPYKMIAQELLNKFRQGARPGGIGSPSRYPWFQRNLLSYPDGKISLAAARPGNGKSILGANEALHTAMLQQPALIISLEMSEEELTSRMICDLMDLDERKFKRGQAAPDDYRQFRIGAEYLDSLPLYIVDNVTTKEGIISTMYEYTDKKNIKFCFLDYIQIVRPSKGDMGSNTNTRLSEVSGAITTATKKLNIHTMIASQLSRFEGNGQFKVKRPELHHLRDTGALEQDAYIVIFLYADPEMEIEPSTNVPTIFDVAKHRSVGPSRTRMIFQKHHNRFTDANGGSLRDIFGDKFMVSHHQEEFKSTETVTEF